MASPLHYKALSRSPLLLFFFLLTNSQPLLIAYLPLASYNSRLQLCYSLCPSVVSPSHGMVCWIPFLVNRLNIIFNSCLFYLNCCCLLISYLFSLHSSLVLFLIFCLVLLWYAKFLNGAVLLEMTASISVPRECLWFSCLPKALHPIPVLFPDFLCFFFCDLGLY